MASASVDPAPPRVALSLERGDSDLVDDASWLGFRVSHDLAGQRAASVEFRGCRFHEANLISIELSNSRVVDCEFVRCEISGATLEEAVLNRVRFTECRMRGVILSLAELRDVEFVDCLLDDLQMRMAKGMRVAFRACSLVGADFYSSDLVNAQLVSSDLTGAEFSQGSFPHGRLHGSKVEALRGVASLRGVTIDWSQVIPLGRQVLNALEIRVDSEKEDESGIDQ